MLITTVRPTALGVALRAWSSLLRAARLMLPLFLVTYVLMAGLGIAIDRLSAILSIPSIDALKEIVTAGRRLPWLGVSEAIGRDVVVCIVQAVIAAPLAVAMHRFILLGETRRFTFATRLTMRFAAWIFLLQIPVMILAWLILFAGPATALVPLLTVVLIALLLFLMQTLQLFPAVAVQEPSETVSARLETALERAEGMFWLALVALVLTFLPIGVVQAVAMRVSVKLVAHAPLIVPLAKAALGIVTVALAAAAVSWLYSYGAHKPKTAIQSQQLSQA
jgi:hypothetical protein